MPIAQHVMRRAAVYYYRRRLPPRLATFQRRRHVFLSMQTSDPRYARCIAAHLDATFEVVVMTNQMLTAAQLDAILQTVVREKYDYLFQFTAAEKSFPGFDPTKAEWNDRCSGWAWRLLDNQGLHAVVRPEDRDKMRAAGLTEADIETVGDRLYELRAIRTVPIRQERLTKLLATQGAEPTAMNLVLAQQMYFRGTSLAFFENARRFSGDVPDEKEIVAAALHLRRDSPPPSVPAASATVAIGQSAQPTVGSPAVSAPSAPDPHVEDDIVTLGDELIAKEAKDKNWGGKLQEQNQQTYALFARFLSEEMKINGLTALRQVHLAAFMKFMRTEVYKHYGKSPKDKDLSIEQLRDQAKTKANEAGDPSLIGLQGGTLNRHLSGLGQLFEYASGQGLELDPKLLPKKLRSKRNRDERARDERLKLPLPVSLRVYYAAPYVGCVDWARASETGLLVFHRALYYGPMLLEYGGFRRDEVCGLCVDDVIDGPIPYLHIRRNEFRRIKNPQSDRKIPIHPELIRLGFLDYVARMRALGYRRVFPDLYSPTTQSSLGDRLYDEFRPILTWACEVENKSVEHDLHSIRHAFDSRLKAKKVSAEDRADLMGHDVGTETSDRYAEAITLENALEVLKKLPILTAHLQPQPLRLLPWVERREVAPFSRPARKPKRAPQGKKVRENSSVS